MGVGPELSARIEAWENSSRWERSELGKDLRREGLSYAEIMALISVKKSTLATWCRDVRLSDEQYAAIKERTGSWIGIPRDTNRKRRDEINTIRGHAATQALVLVHEPLWTAGTALYWGEGYKTQSTLGMANAEPAALRLFLSWTRAYHDETAEFRARLNVHANNDESRARQWWSAELGIELGNFTKTFIKPDGTGHRKNHLAHGVCAVRMRRSADAFHRTIAWVEFLADRLGN